MKKIPLKDIGLDLYTEVLDNGLEIYIIPNNKVNDIYVTYSTKYGSNKSEFVPIDGKKMIKVPEGIAHFLEHKMFEQKDGTDVFSFYSERGSNANANTNNYKTTYLFSGPNYYEENLEFLLNYVNSPYFTHENVIKEQGIIDQEISMYKDSPYSTLGETILFNAFHKDPMKYPVIGTSESIHKITEDDLYTCYNTFYNPSNMFIVITGNVDSSQSIALIKTNQLKNKKESGLIKLKTYNEPDFVFKECEIKKMNIMIPKSAIAYKVRIPKDIDLRVFRNYIKIFFQTKFGVTSKFVSKLRDLELITYAIDVSIVMASEHILVVIGSDTKNPELLIDMIKKEMKESNILEKDFKRNKKVMISTILYMSDNIYGVNNTICSNIAFYGNLEFDPIKDIKNLEYEELKRVIKMVNFDNYTVCSILKK